MRDYSLDWLLKLHGIATSDYFDMFTLHSTSTYIEREAAREAMQQAAGAVQDYISHNYTRSPQGDTHAKML